MTAEETFWNWFNQHEDEISAFETNQEKLFDQLATQLHRIDPNLTFEFGPQETKTRVRHQRWWHKEFVSRRGLFSKGSAFS